MLAQNKKIQGASILKKRRGYLIYVKKLKEIAEGDFFLEFDIKNQSFPLNLCTQILSPPQLCALKFCPPLNSVYSNFVPPSTLCTQILSPPLNSVHSNFVPPSTLCIQILSPLNSVHSNLCPPPKNTSPPPTHK